MDLVRAADGQPESVVAGAWYALSFMAIFNPPAAKAVWETEFLETAMSALERYNPMQQVSRQQLVPGALLDCIKNVQGKVQNAGGEVIQPLLDAGAVDIAISILTAYRMLGNPSEANVLAVASGGLNFLELSLIHI